MSDTSDSPSSSENGDLICETCGKEYLFYCPKEKICKKCRWKRDYKCRIWTEEDNKTCKTCTVSLTNTRRHFHQETEEAVCNNCFKYYGIHKKDRIERRAGKMNKEKEICSNCSEALKIQQQRRRDHEEDPVCRSCYNIFLKIKKGQIIDFPEKKPMKPAICSYCPRELKYEPQGRYDRANNSICGKCYRAQWYLRKKQQYPKIPPKCDVRSHMISKYAEQLEEQEIQYLFKKPPQYCLWRILMMPRERKSRTKVKEIGSEILSKPKIPDPKPKIEEKKRNKKTIKFGLQHYGLQKLCPEKRIPVKVEIEDLEGPECSEYDSDEEPEPDVENFNLNDYNPGSVGGPFHKWDDEYAVDSPETMDSEKLSMERDYLKMEYGGSGDDTTDFFHSPFNFNMRSPNSMGSPKSIDLNGLMDDDIGFIDSPGSISELLNFLDDSAIMDTNGTMDSEMKTSGLMKIGVMKTNDTSVGQDSKFQIFNIDHIMGQGSVGTSFANTPSLEPSKPPEPTPYPILRALLSEPPRKSTLLSTVPVLKSQPSINQKTGPKSFKIDNILSNKGSKIQGTSDPHGSRCPTVPSEPPKQDQSQDMTSPLLRALLMAPSSRYSGAQEDSSPLKGPHLPKDNRGTNGSSSELQKMPKSASDLNSQKVMDTEDPLPMPSSLPTVVKDPSMPENFSSSRSAFKISVSQDPDIHQQQLYIHESCIMEIDHEEIIEISSPQGLYHLQEPDHHLLSCPQFDPILESSSYLEPPTEDPQILIMDSTLVPDFVHEEEVYTSEY